VSNRSATLLLFACSSCCCVVALVFIFSLFVLVFVYVVEVVDGLKYGIGYNIVNRCSCRKMTLRTSSNWNKETMCP